MAAARSKLKAAHGSLRDAELRRDHARDGVSRAQALVSKANAGLTEAKAAVIAATQQRALVLANGDEQPNTAVRSARDAEGYAAEAVTDAKQALRINEQRLDAAVADVAQNMRDVAAARSEVYREFPFKRLLDAILAKREELEHLMLIGRSFHMAGDVPPELEKEFKAALMNTGGLPGTRGSVFFQDWDAHPVSKDWAAWREALLTDPDAPMPRM
jgi:hypothetical protein